MEDVVITWDRSMLERFKQAYENAQKKNAPTFKFEGNLFVPSYAKYLIEYLDAHLT